MKFILNHKQALLYGLIIAGYAVLLLVRPQLGPTDDFTFLRTIEQGHPLAYYDTRIFPYYNVLELGRFTPLASVEYNLARVFLDIPGAFWFYLYHVIQLIIFSFVVVWLLRRATENKWVIYGSALSIFLTAGFAITFFRLQMNERNVIFFVALFLLAFFKFQEQQKARYIVYGLLALNAAIYYKETGFIVAVVFGLSHLILSWRERSSIRAKFFDVLIALSGIGYFIVYMAYVFPHRGYLGIPYPPFNPILIHFKNFLNYGFFSDPIPMLIGLSLVAWRIYQILKQHANVEPIWDSMLVTAVAYGAAFFKLHMYSPYYMFPAYILVVPSAIYFLYTKDWWRHIFWKCVLVLVGILTLGNVVPAHIHYLTYYKYITNNFEKTLDVLVAAIEDPARKKPLTIFLDGVDRGSGQGGYFVLADFLLYRGVPTNAYDMKSNIEALEKVPFFNTRTTFPFTVFKEGPLPVVKSGDYIIVTPANTTIVDLPAHIKELKKDNTLLFSAEGRFAFPSWNLKTLAKYIILKLFPSRNKSNGVIVSTNISELPYYYVFVRK